MGYIISCLHIIYINYAKLVVYMNDFFLYIGNDFRIAQTPCK